ncbi:MAG: glycosyltransferase family 4 protein [Caldilineaceae bacterium]
MRSLHIAFLTDEFVTEQPAGGLGNYLNRITRLLCEQGHQPEVFVTSSNQPAVIDYNGVRVERVPRSRNILLRYARAYSKTYMKAPWGGPVDYLMVALALSQAFEKRHAVAPFDFVQSTNCAATGLFVRRLPNRPHLIRLSSHRGLWFATDGQNGLNARMMSWLESICAKRANIAYAPSQFLATYCQKSYHRTVEVVRPPIFIEAEADTEIPAHLPKRYLLHFGQIGPRKGSDVLAKALCTVWEQVPDLKMIWAGNVIQPGDYERCHRLWGKHAQNVIWLGAVSKAELYAILQRADAAVLPSRVDNLPNTVIESLAFGIPVIGSDGASIDELVRAEVNGVLISIGNSEALADAMIKFWQGQVACTKGVFDGLAALPESFNPSIAVRNLIQLAGYE